MDKNKVFQSNQESTARMKQLIQGLSDEQLTSILPNGWTVSVALAHLAFWDQRVIQVIELAGKVGKVTPSNYDDSLNDLLEPFLRAIPSIDAANMAIKTSENLDRILEESSTEIFNQLEEVNHRWVERSLHRNGHLNDIESFLGNN